MPNLNGNFRSRPGKKVMATNQQDKQRKDQEKQERQQLTEVIRKSVLNTLGQPSDLNQVQVRRLWDNHYRVNVLTGKDASSIKVASSFFLLVDEGGVILESTPKMKKQY